jgi:hypothetical protein
MFVGFLASEAFVIAGDKTNVEAAVADITREFNAVLPFILQDEGYKPGVTVDSVFESERLPRLSIIYEESEKAKMKQRREEIRKSKGSGNSGIGSYTYDEILKLFGNNNLDIRITRDPSGVRLHVSKGSEDL